MKLLIWTLLIVLCNACSKQEPPVDEPVKKSGNAANAAAKSEARPIEFPRDEGVHRESPIEWWYLNAQFSDTKGGQYAFAYCKFSTGRHLVAFFNKTADTAGAKDYYEEVTASDSKLDLSSITGKWKETGPFASSFFYNFEGLKLDLALKARKKPFLPGGNGFIAMGEQGTSHYYALTDMSLTGTVTMGTNEVKVTGKAWMDHQWGKWDWVQDFSQWKWFGVKLENGVDLMLFNLYRDKQLVGSHCGYMDAAGNQFHKIGSELITREYFHDTNGGKWQKVVELRLPSLTNTVLTLTSEHDGQFVEPNVLWEGSMKVTGTFNNQAVKGTAFGELNRPD